MFVAMLSLFAVGHWIWEDSDVHQIRETWGGKFESFIGWVGGWWGGLKKQQWL